MRRRVADVARAGRGRGSDRRAFRRGRRRSGQHRHDRAAQQRHVRAGGVRGVVGRRDPVADLAPPARGRAPGDHRAGEAGRRRGRPGRGRAWMPGPERRGSRPGDRDRRAIGDAGIAVEGAHQRREHWPAEADRCAAGGHRRGAGRVHEPAQLPVGRDDRRARADVAQRPVRRRWRWVCCGATTSC